MVLLRARQPQVRDENGVRVNLSGEPVPDEPLRVVRELVPLIRVPVHSALPAPHTRHHSHGRTVPQGNRFPHGRFRHAPARLDVSPLTGMDRPSAGAYCGEWPVRPPGCPHWLWSGADAPPGACHRQPRTGGRHDDGHTIIDAKWCRIRPGPRWRGPRAALRDDGPLPHLRGGHPPGVPRRQGAGLRHRQGSGPRARCTCPPARSRSPRVSAPTSPPTTPSPRRTGRTTSRSPTAWTCAKMTAEIFGRETGLGRGRGGHMHLFDPDHPLLLLGHHRRGVPARSRAGLRLQAQGH